MNGLRIRSKHHSAPGLFQSISQFDIFHAIDPEVFVETPDVQKHLCRSRYIARVVIRKINGSFGWRVGIQNPVVSKITQEGICSIAPRHTDGANDRCIRILAVPVQMSLDQCRFRLNIIVDKQDQVAVCQPETCISCRGGPGFLLHTKFQIGKDSGLLFEDIPRVITRVIIHDNDFVLLSGKRLTLDPFNSFGKQCRAILSWDDDTKLRHSGSQNFLRDRAGAEGPLPSGAYSANEVSSKRTHGCRLAHQRYLVRRRYGIYRMWSTKANVYSTRLRNEYLPKTKRFKRKLYKTRFWFQVPNL